MAPPPSPSAPRHQGLYARRRAGFGDDLTTSIDPYEEHTGPGGRRRQSRGEAVGRGRRADLRGALDHALTNADLAAVARPRSRAAAAEDIVAGRPTPSATACAYRERRSPDAVLVEDLGRHVAPEIEVIFLDTQYHFDKTLATLDVVHRRSPIKLAPHPGAAISRTDTDACCGVHKVAQLERRCRADGWLSVCGARRPDRAGTPMVSGRRGLVERCNPGSRRDPVDDPHPLRPVARRPVEPVGGAGSHRSGVVSPCTRPLAEGDDKRAGRGG